MSKSCVQIGDGGLNAWSIEISLELCLIWKRKPYFSLLVVRSPGWFSGVGHQACIAVTDAKARGGNVVGPMSDASSEAMPVLRVCSVCSCFVLRCSTLVEKSARCGFWWMSGQ